MTYRKDHRSGNPRVTPQSSEGDSKKSRRSRSRDIDPRGAQSLIDLLERQAGYIEELATMLLEERRAFVSARPSDLEGAIEALQSTADRAVGLESERLRRMADLFGVSEIAAERLRGSDLLGQLPAECRHAFESVAERLNIATVRLQGETRLGANMLRFAAKTQDEVFRSIYAAQVHKDAEKAGDVLVPRRTYDHTATTQDSPVPTLSTGRLVDGTI